MHKYLEGVFTNMKFNIKTKKFLNLIIAISILFDVISCVFLLKSQDSECIMVMLYIVIKLIVTINVNLTHIKRISNELLKIFILFLGVSVIIFIHVIFKPNIIFSICCVPVPIALLIYTIICVKNIKKLK